MSRDQVTYYRDPNLQRGPYRVLPRTDGAWIVFDDRAPLGHATAAVEPTAHDAARRLLELAALAGVLLALVASLAGCGDLIGVGDAFIRDGGGELGDGATLPDVAQGADAGELGDARRDHGARDSSPVDGADLGDGFVADAGGDSVAADVASADGDDSPEGCALVGHTDGQGHAFVDCVPFGDYSQPLALDACLAFNAGNPACQSVNCPGHETDGSVFGDGGTAIGVGIVTPTGGGAAQVLWYSAGPYAGQLYAGPAAPGECPAPTGGYE